MAATTSASCGQVAVLVAGDEDPHLRDGLVQQHLEPAHDGAADARSSSWPARSARARRRRRAARRSARIASGYGMSIGVPPGQRRDDRARDDHRAIHDPERADRRGRCPRAAASGSSDRAFSGSRADTSTRVAPSWADGREHGRRRRTRAQHLHVRPATSPRRRAKRPTMPATSVLNPRLHPVVEQHGVRGSHLSTSAVRSSEQRQHLALQRHRQRQTAPGCIQAVEERPRVRRPRTSIAEYSQSSPSTA